MSNIIPANNYVLVKIIEKKEGISGFWIQEDEDPDAISEFEIIKCSKTISDPSIFKGRTVFARNAYIEKHLINGENYNFLNYRNIIAIETEEK